MTTDERASDAHGATGDDAAGHPENCRASQDGPASRSKRMPATMPITRTRRNVTTGRWRAWIDPPYGVEAKNRASKLVARAIASMFGYHARHPRHAIEAMTGRSLSFVCEISLIHMNDGHRFAPQLKLSPFRD